MVTSPVRAWLDLQCQMIAGVEAGVLVVDRNAEAWVWPADREAPPRLSATVALAIERETLAVQGASEAASDGVVAVAVPIVLDDGRRGAFGVTVRGLPAAEVKSLAGLLSHGARGLSLLLDASAGERTLARRLELAGTLLDHDGLREAAHAACASLARALGCERVSLGLASGSGRRARFGLVALSTNPSFERASDEVRALESAIAEAVGEDEVIALPAPGPAVAAGTPAHEELRRASRAGSLCTVPLASRDAPVGAIVFEWADAAIPSADRVAAATDAALLCGPILALMARAEAGTRTRLRTAWERWSERHFGEERRVAKWGVLAVAIAIVAIALLPGTHRVGARATLEGRVQRALVAGVGGYLAESHARAGDLVTEGALLARLDDRDLRLERRERESEHAELEAEYREALASRDRAQVSLLQARLDAASAQLALATEQLGRTQIRAPFDGIVLDGDWNQALGSPIELGAVLFEIAPLDGYRIIFEIDGRDIADVAVGQRGALALESLPGTTLPLAVERITPVSTTRDGRTFFRAEAVLVEPHEGLRPGMEGVAKIEIGSRALGWIWTHELLDWLRLQAWSWLP